MINTAAPAATPAEAPGDLVYRVWVDDSEFRKAFESGPMLPVEELDRLYDELIKVRLEPVRDEPVAEAPAVETRTLKLVLSILGPDGLPIVRPGITVNYEVPVHRGALARQLSAALDRLSGQAIAAVVTYETGAGGLAEVA